MNTDQEIKPEESKPPSWARRAMLPPRYQTGRIVSSAPMGGSADLIFDLEGRVAWDQIWNDFCDLALAGGPPHRGTMLSFATVGEIDHHPELYDQVVAELIRGLALVTGWRARIAAQPGRIELMCPGEDAAAWLEEAVNAENVRAERSGASLFLPAGPMFALKEEIKNVVTAVAKAHHYWTEHGESIDSIRKSSIGARLESA
jgi:sirohydrochlorin cobaltochelatase